MPPVILAIVILQLCISRTFATDICYAGSQRAIVARDRLYFMGGMYISPGEKKEFQQSLFSLNLDTKFPVDGWVTDKFLQNRSFTSTPSKGTGAFWTDANQTMLYTIGGEFSGKNPGRSTLQAYNMQSDVWQTVSVDGGSYQRGNRFGAMHASSFDGGGQLSFISGGYDDYPGLLIFNSSDPQRPSWKNVTNDNIPFFQFDATQYVRYGEAGVLVSVGGFVTRPTPGNVQSREMNSVQIYDIASERFSTVFATGDVPSPRSRFCSAITAAPDDSSFHLIIHGGWDEKAGLDDVYILVMPAFRWIKINTTGALAHETGDRWQELGMGRMDHYCSTYKDRQMVVLGGWYKLNTNDSTTCSSHYPALRMLDTTTFEWQTQFPLSDTSYKVPQLVVDVVGGGPSGGAEPASTWQQTLGSNTALFSKTIPRFDPDHPPLKKTEPIPNANGTDSRNDSQVAPQPTQEPLDPHEPQTSSRVRVGTIAGSVVGGVAAIAFATISLCLIAHRKRQARLQSEQGERQWKKAELASRSPRPFAGRRDFRQHEVVGNDPLDFIPREMDGANFRREAPSVLNQIELE